MSYLRISIVCLILALLFVPATLWSQSDSSAAKSNYKLSYEFSPTGAASAEEAAIAMFRGVALRSPKDFARHLLLGVCDGPIGSVNKYAESLHFNLLTNGEESLTVYDLPERMKKDTEQVLSSLAFSEAEVDSLRSQFLSSYYCQDLISCVEVAGESYGGKQYRTRIVVVCLNDVWFAMPRCRSSKSFYAIADAMEFESIEL